LIEKDEMQVVTNQRTIMTATEYQPRTIYDYDGMHTSAVGMEMNKLYLADLVEHPEEHSMAEHIIFDREDCPLDG
jgi:hypothetical protein